MTGIRHCPVLTRWETARVALTIIVITQHQ